MGRAIIAVIMEDESLSKDGVFEIISKHWELPYSMEEFESEFSRILQVRKIVCRQDIYHASITKDIEKL